MRTEIINKKQTLLSGHVKAKWYQWKNEQRSLKGLVEKTGHHIWNITVSTDMPNLEEPKLWQFCIYVSRGNLWKVKKLK